MPSKLDDYLSNASSEELAAIKEHGNTVENNANSVENISYNNEPSTPVASGEPNNTTANLDENTAERIQNINEGQGNNYLNESTETKDSLAKYPEKEQQGTEQSGQSLEKDNEQER